MLFLPLLFGKFLSEINCLPLEEHAFYSYLCHYCIHHPRKRGMEMTAIFIFISIKHSGLELAQCNVKCLHLNGASFSFECFGITAEMIFFLLRNQV